MYWLPTDAHQSKTEEIDLCKGLTDLALHLTKLEKLMKEKGKLTLGVVHCMPFGSPRIGKTCVKDRLAGKKPKGTPAAMKDGKVVYPEDVSLSTGMAENVMKLVETTYQEQEQGARWTHLTLNEEVISVVKGLETVTEEIRSSRPLEPSEHSSVPIPVQPETPPSTNDVEPDGTSEQKSVQRPSSNSAHDDPSLQEVHYQFSTPLETVSEAFHFEDSSQVQALLEGSLVIHFTDTGGQPEFQEVLPALVAGPSLFFLCFSLATGLNHRYKVWYDCRNDSSEPYESSYTVKDVMLQCLASIACIGTQRKNNGETKIMKPKVFFIGTQVDLVSSEEVKQIDSELREAIQYHQELSGLVEYHTASPPQVLFLVNNYDEEDHCFEVIRNAVHAVAIREEEIYRVSLPVPFATLDFYLRKPKECPLSPQLLHSIVEKHGVTPADLEQSVRSVYHQTGAIYQGSSVNLTDPKVLAKAVQTLSKASEVHIRESHKEVLLELNELSHCSPPIITMEEFKAICKTYDITAEECEEALWTLHHLLGTIRHFPEVKKLKDVVITNSQLFFNVATKLITGTFSLKLNRQFLTPQACLDFHSKGFFTQEDLDKVWSQEKEHLSSEQLVALLEHLHIIAPLEYEGKSCFFLPCALKHAPLQASASDKPMLPPLLVSFECGFVPKGIFSGLLAYLLQHAHKDGLLWDLQRDLLFCDQASLDVIPFVTLTIQATPMFIRFSLYQQREIRSCDVCAVRRVIEEGLRVVVSRLNYAVRSEPSLGFECICDVQKSVHFTEYKHKPLYVPKCVVSGRYYDPPSHYLSWFEGSSTSEDRVQDQSSPDTLRVTDPSSTNPVIPSVNSLLLELPLITDPLDFGLCLRVDYDRCQQILRDKQGDTRSQGRAIAAEWFTHSSEPTWEEVVDALFRHHRKKEAVQLAEKKGVDWRPLESKYQEQ